MALEGLAVGVLLSYRGLGGSSVQELGSIDELGKSSAFGGLLLTSLG